MQSQTTIFIDSNEPGVSQIISAFDLAELPDSRIILEQHVFPEMRAADNERKIELSNYLLRPHSFVNLGKKVKTEMSRIPFVPVRGRPGRLTSPVELVDPTSTVARLYFEDEDVFPTEDYLEEMRENMIALGMIWITNDTVVLERLQKFSESAERLDEVSSKAQHLLSGTEVPPSLDTELRWIPASKDGVKKLCNAKECRNHSYKNLVGYSMPLTELEVSKNWRKELGWSVKPNDGYILKQLDEAIARKDNIVVRSLLQVGWLFGEEIGRELCSKSWIPGMSGGYHQSSNIFRNGPQLHPYIDVLDSAFKDFFTASHFSIGEEPSIVKVWALPLAATTFNSFCVVTRGT